MAKVLIVDDEKMQRKIMRDILLAEKHTLFEAADVSEAVPILEREGIEVTLTDLSMPGKSGLDLIHRASQITPRPEIVVITAFGTIETAVRAMRTGAYDYLTKPIEREELVLVVHRAAEKHQLLQNAAQWSRIAYQQASKNIIAESAAMQKILEMVKKIAHSDATILLRGASGTGKERIARLIHSISPYRDKPMHSINCAALPDSLLESELFGYERGAFTGAHSRKIGILEAATNSTLLLDEIAEMSLPTQAKILRSIQEKEIRRLGGTENIPISIRLIAATNKDLEKAVAEGSFREDLFYRLNVIPVTIPPLHERPADIEPLTMSVLARRGGKTLHPEAMKMLKAYRWPGNVRELEAVIERMHILSANQEITVDDLPPEIRSPSTSPSPGPGSLPAEGIVFEKWEKNLLEQAVTKSNGVMSEAAKLLGMTYRTFQYRAEKFGILKKPE